MKIVQNNIEFILNQHSIIPVVTIDNMNEIAPKINSILDKFDVLSSSPKSDVNINITFDVDN